MAATIEQLGLGCGLHTVRNDLCSDPGQRHVDSLDAIFASETLLRLTVSRCRLIIGNLSVSKVFFRVLHSPT